MVFIMFGTAIEADHLNQKYIEDYNRKVTER